MSFWEKLFMFWNQTLVLQKHVLWMTITPKHIHYSQEILILLPKFNVVQYLAQNTFHYIKNCETRLIRQRKLIRVTQNTLSLAFNGKRVLIKVVMLWLLLYFFTFTSEAKQTPLVSQQYF